MTDFYLLPCPHCGYRHRVGPTQAGQTLSCTCGRAVEVPGLREIRNLELAPPEEATTAPPAKTSWNIPKMLTLVGVLIMLAGVALGVLFWSTRPRPYPVDRMTPAELWALWQRYDSRGLPRRYVRNDPFVQEMQARRLWYLIAAGIFTFGALVVAFSRFIPILFAEEPPPEPSEEEAEVLNGQEDVPPDSDAESSSGRGTSTLNS